MFNLKHNKAGFCTICT